MNTVRCVFEVIFTDGTRIYVKGSSALYVETCVKTFYKDKTVVGVSKAYTYIE